MVHVAAAQTFTPGKTTMVSWDPVKQELPVYVPTDYTDQKKWPVIVFFHGTHGSPTLWDGV